MNLIRAARSGHYLLDTGKKTSLTKTGYSYLFYLFIYLFQIIVYFFLNNLLTRLFLS